MALLLFLVVCGICLWPAGCSTPKWFRPKAKHGHSIPGVTAPHERISRLREQRKQASTFSAEAAEQLAAQLARECGDEEDPLIRAELVLTLGTLRSPTARQALLAAGQDPNSRVRMAACKAWGEIADETASGELARIVCADMDQEVRVAAVRALGKAGGPHAVPALGTALEDRNPAMQFLAMESLEEVTGQDYGHDARLWKQYVQDRRAGSQEESVAQRPGAVY